LIALLGGSIDATLASPPDHLEAVRAGMKILLNLRELNVAYVEGIHLVKTNASVSKRAFAKYRQTRDEKQLEMRTKLSVRSLSPSRILPSRGFKRFLKTPAIGFRPQRPPIPRILSTSVCSKNSIAPDTSIRSIAERTKEVEIRSRKSEIA